MRFARLVALSLGLPLLALAQENSTEGLINSLTSNINIEGLETSYDPETGIASAKGDVHILYGDAEIRSGRADYNYNTGDIMAKENVTIVKGGITYRTTCAVFKNQYTFYSGFFLQLVQLFSTGKPFPIHSANIHISLPENLAFQTNIL